METCDIFHIFEVFDWVIQLGRKSHRESCLALVSGSVSSLANDRRVSRLFKVRFVQETQGFGMSALEAWWFNLTPDQTFDRKSEQG